MKTITLPLLSTLLGLFRSRAHLHLELLSLRQQLAMAKQKPHNRLRFNGHQRLFWICLYRLWPGCLQTLEIFRPDTLIRWHHKGFKLYWRWKSHNYHGGRPKISPEVRELIRTMSQENMGWGAPRIHGELKMLGIDISQATIAKYMVKHRKPPSQTRDRDSIYSARFRRRVHSLNMEEVCTAPRSSWQNPFVERLIGSIRRECLNHVIVLNERHLRSILRDYFSYYHTARTHLSLDIQCPKPRAVQLPNQGKVVSFQHLGGLHHEYRRAA